MMDEKCEAMHRGKPLHDAPAAKRISLIGDAGWSVRLCAECAALVLENYPDTIVEEL